MKLYRQNESYTLEEECGFYHIHRELFKSQSIGIIIGENDLARFVHQNFNAFIIFGNISTDIEHGVSINEPGAFSRKLMQNIRRNRNAQNLDIFMMDNGDWDGYRLILSPGSRDLDNICEFEFKNRVKYDVGAWSYSLWLEHIQEGFQPAELLIMNSLYKEYSELNGLIFFVPMNAVVEAKIEPGSMQLLFFPEA